MYFTGIACVAYDEFWNDLIKSKDIQNLLMKEFVSVVLYVDDKRAIELRDTLDLADLNFSKNGKSTLNKFKTKGEINSIIEVDFFQSNSQPLYVILNSDKQTIIDPFGYVSRDEETFIGKLKEGLNKFNEQNTRVFH